jgi:CHAT domain-containing protein
MTDPTSETSFLDLEIRILPPQRLAQQGAGYPVEITLGGQQEFGPGLLAADILPWTPTDDPAADGQRLFEALLADPALRSAWDQAQGRSPQRRIRLRIDRGAAELHALPWELLHGGQGMLAAHADTPLSRYLPVSLPWGGALQERPIRVLAVISNPSDLEKRFKLAPLDEALERSILEEGLAELGAGEVELAFLEPPVTLARLEEKLREGYHVLHYTGHGAYSEGRGQAALYLQAEEGNTEVVTDEALIGMLARQGVKPRLITLAACQSASSGREPGTTRDAYLGLAPKLVAIGVPAVVAMQDTVTIETAQALSRAFYGRLAEHGAVDRAINEARSALLTAGRPDAAVPVLFMRLRSGQLWSDEVDARGQVLGSQTPKVFWEALIRCIEHGQCIPIVGPRAHGPWLPEKAEIARALAAKYQYPFANVEDLARVTQYIATSVGDDFARDEVLDALRASLAQRLPKEYRLDDRYGTLAEWIRQVRWDALVADHPNETHQVLASLELPLYLTTNADPFMVEALRARGKEAKREICRWNEDLEGLPSLFEREASYELGPDTPLVYHLYGSDEEPSSLVLTEDHYLDFLMQISEDRTDHIHPLIDAALANSPLMFVGYGLYDWEFRVLLRVLVARPDRRRKLKHVCVQLETEAAQQAGTAVQTFLQQYFTEANINVFWGSTAQYIAELRERWEARSG